MTSLLRIAVFAPFFPPDPTGSAVFARDQVQALVDLGHQVCVVTNRPKKAQRRDGHGIIHVDSNPRIIYVDCFRLSLGKASWNYKLPFSLMGLLRPSLFRTLRNFQPEAVVVHSTLFDLSLFALIWSNCKRIPTILVGHTALWHETYIVRLALEQFGKRILGPLVKSELVAVVCVDEWTNNNAQKTFARSKPITVIPVSVGIQNVRGGDWRKAARFVPLDQAPVILSLGHVVAVRNRHRLVKSLPLLLREFPRLVVLVVGMVNDESFLRIAENLGVRSQIHLVGKVAHEEIRHFLALADVETHDLDGRGLGITSIEAMAAETPIVAWVSRENYPGINLESFGPLGFLRGGEPEQIASMISKVLRDKQFASQVVKTQLKLVSNVFSTEAITTKYLIEIQRLCDLKKK